MIDPSRAKTILWVAAVSLVTCGAAVMIYWSFSRPRGPTLYSSALDANARTAIVVLTNTTTRSWLFELHLVQGLPRPSYFITDQKKGLPGWGMEADEGIYCSGYIYRRDPSGRYGAPERAGRSPRFTYSYTNFALHPQQGLAFTVPIGDIPGLSKVGVIYHRPPAASWLHRTGTDVLARIRRILHLKPPTPFTGWCETELAKPSDW